MNAFTTYYLDIFKKHYFDFNGRATRKQYWMFVLFNIIVYFVLGILANFLGEKLGAVVLALFNLAVLLPGLGLSVRRLHDTDRSGWWILINILPILGPIVYLVFMVLPSAEGATRFDK